MGLGDVLANVGDALQQANDMAKKIPGVGDAEYAAGADAKFLAKKVIKPVYDKTAGPVLDKSWDLTLAANRDATTLSQLPNNPAKWFDKDVWAEAHHNAAGTNVGESLTHTISGLAQDVVHVGTFGQADASSIPGLGGAHGVTAVAKSNFGDPIAREQLFNGGLAKFESAAVNAVLLFKFDPLVGAGKAIGAGRAALFTKPLKPIETTRLAGETADEHAQRIGDLNTARADDITRIGPTGELQPVGNQFTASGKADAFAQHYMNIADPNERLVNMLRNPVYVNNPSGAQYLSRATDLADFKLRLRSQLSMTNATAETMTAEKARVFDELNNVIDPRLSIFEDELKLMQAGAIPHDTDTYTKHVVDLAQQRRLLAQQDDLEQLLQSQGTMGTLHNVPGVPLGAKAAKVWESRTGSDWYTMQVKGFNPVSVLRSATTLRPGIATIDQPGSGAHEVMKMFDGASRLGADITPELRSQHIGNVVRAESLGDAPSHAQAIMDAESAVISALARTKLAGPGADDATIRDAEATGFALSKSFHRKRNETIQTLRAQSKAKEQALADIATGIKAGTMDTRTAEVERQKALELPNDPMFSQARDPQARDPRTGSTADEMVTLAGTLTKVPIFNSMLANGVPIIDVRRLAETMDRHRTTMNAENGGNLRDQMASWWGGDAGKATLTTEGGKELLDVFNRLWKPAQLLRLGWPQRVIIDEQMRIMAKLGAMTYLEYVGRNLKNNVTSSDRVYRLKDLATAGKRAAAAKEAEALGVEAPVKLREHEGVVADLANVMMRRQLLEQRAAEIEARDWNADLPQGTMAHPDTLEPITLYHGTPSAHGEALDPAHANSTDPNFSGTYFTDDPSEASGYASDRSTPESADGPNIHPVHLSGKVLDFRRTPISRELAENILLHTGADEETKLNVLRALEQTHGRGSLGSLADLRDEFYRQTPDISVMDRKPFYDAAGEALKGHGYRVISNAPGRAGTGSRYVALHKDAIVPKFAAHKRHIDELDAIEHELLENAAAHADLSGSRQALEDWMDASQARADRLTEQAAPPSATPKGYRGPNDYMNRHVTLTAHGLTVSREGGLAGTHGRTFADLTSAATTTRSLAGLDERRMNHLKVVLGDTASVHPVVPETMKNPTTAKLYRETYDRGWERAVNDQIGADPLGRKLLEQKLSDDEIVDWMRNTAEGAEYVRKAHSLRRENSLLDWVAQARQHVEHYVPTDRLKQLALERRATSGDLRAIVQTDSAKAAGKTDTDLPVIHAESLDQVLGYSRFWHTFNGFVDKTYAKMATAPTDVMSRHPFFEAMYSKEMQRRFANLGVTSTDDISDHTWMAMERGSRQHALQQVKSLLYDTANQTDLAHTMRFVMPFYMAWQDAIVNWGKLWMEDPSRLARMYQTWEAPQRGFQTQTDQSGNKHVLISLPHPILKALGMNTAGEATMPAHWMRDLIFQGKYWYMPGFGAPVAVPVAAAVRDRPDLAKVMEPLVPYGAGTSWADQVLPAGWKNAKSLGVGDDDETWVKTRFSMFQDLYTERRLGKNDYSDTELWQKAADRANDLSRLKIASAFSLPFSAGFNSPYQLYRDMWTNLSEQQRKNPTAFGMITDTAGITRPKTAQEQFLEKAGPDYFVFTEAATKSNVGGIAPTVEGYRGFEKYKDLIRQMPDMGSLIVGDTTGQYSSSVQQWMLSNQIGPGQKEGLREVRSPEQGVRDAEVQRGWEEYRKLANAVDAALAERGLRSVRSKAAEDIKTKRDVVLHRLMAQYPAFGEEFGTFDRSKADRRVDFMTKLVQDPRVADRPGFKSLIQYLALRKIVVNELAQREAAGGSQNLQAKKNDDLRIKFEVITGRMAQQDTAFSDLHTRWLSSDDLDTGGILPGQATTPAVARPTANTSVGRSMAPTTEPTAPSLLEPGNIDIHHRPVVHNTDGTISTVRSITITDDSGRAILIPTVSEDGRIMSNAEAVTQYQKTHRHLGIFKNEAAADNYAQNLHEAQAKEYGG